MPKNLKPAKKKGFWQCSHLWIELMPWPRKEKKHKQKPPFFVSPQHLPKVHTYENLFHHFHQPPFLTETKLPGTSSADSSARPMPWGSNKRNAWWLRQMDKESALPPMHAAGDGQLQWPCQGWNFPYSNWWSLECVGFKSPAVNGVLLHYQVLPSDLFGCFKSDPFQGLSDLHWGDQKVTWKKLVERSDFGWREYPQNKMQVQLNLRLGNIGTVRYLRFTINTAYLLPYASALGGVVVGKHFKDARNVGIKQ